MLTVFLSFSHIEIQFRISDHIDFYSVFIFLGINTFSDLVTAKPYIYIYIYIYTHTHKDNASTVLNK